MKNKKGGIFSEDKADLIEASKRLSKASAAIALKNEIFGTSPFVNSAISPYNEVFMDNGEIMSQSKDKLKKGDYNRMKKAVGDAALENHRDFYRRSIFNGAI